MFLLRLCLKLTRPLSTFPDRQNCRRGPQAVVFRSLRRRDLPFKKFLSLKVVRLFAVLRDVQSFHFVLFGHTQTGQQIHNLE